MTRTAILLACLLTAVPLAADPQAEAETKPIAAMDLLVMGQAELAPGSLAGMRVLTRAVFDIGDSRPLPLVRVKVSLLGPAGRELVLREGLSDLLGQVNLSYTVPDWPDGQARLRVEADPASFGLALQRQERIVDLRSRVRIVLSTDLPAYSAEQEIRMRVLALGLINRRPVSERELRLSLSAPDEAQVLQRLVQTDDFGIASARLALPAGLSPGLVRLSVGPAAEGAPVWAQRLIRLLAADGGHLEAPERPANAAPAAFERVGLSLHSDKLRYEAGEPIRLSLTATEPNGTCYVDVLKAGQTLWTRSLPIVEGRGELSLLPGPEISGLLQVHAYLIRADGEILRDARHVFVQAADRLELRLERDQAGYRPGQQARIRIRVVDRQGEPRVAALGLIIADESSAESFFSSLEEQAGPFARPEPWDNPLRIRQAKAQADVEPIRRALLRLMRREPLGDRGVDGRWRWRGDLMRRLLAAGGLDESHSVDPLGVPYSPESLGAISPELEAGRFIPQQELSRRRALREGLVDCLAGAGPEPIVGRLEPLTAGCLERLLAARPELGRDLTGAELGEAYLRDEPGFRVSDLIDGLHARRAREIYAALSRYGAENQQWFRVSVLDPEREAWVFPEAVLSRLVKRGLLREGLERDLWGRPFFLRERGEASEPAPADRRLRFVELCSAGMDGEAGNGDDRVYGHGDEPVLGRMAASLGLEPEAAPSPALEPKPAPAEPAPPGLVRPAPGAPPLVFMPALRTDEQGRAELIVEMGRRVRPWHLLILGSSPDGALGVLRHRIEMRGD